MSKEDAFLAKVAGEIAAGQLDRALWTKAFAQADEAALEPAGSVNAKKGLGLRIKKPIKATQKSQQSA